MVGKGERGGRRQKVKRGVRKEKKKNEIEEEEEAEGERKKGSDKIQK